MNLVYPLPVAKSACDHLKKDARLGDVQESGPSGGGVERGKRRLRDSGLYIRRL